jgi:glycosyltransferase involved in cell wall biosynthesis
MMALSDDLGLGLSGAEDFENFANKTTNRRLSVIIPAFNAAGTLEACLTSLGASNVRNYECIVVDDGSLDGTAEVARRFNVTLLSTEGRRGPAFARNLGAAASSAEVLVFIDADVCVRADTLARIVRAFDQDSELDAVLGSYDDCPAAPEFVSKYRNLMHCYVHRHAKRKTSTFWSGCGAIRRTVFQQMAGFDESYARPSVEDIELGYRLRAANKNVALDPDLMVRHLKRWTFREVVRTDILSRGIPWTELILRDRNMPNDLNLRFSQRMSVALVFIALIACVAALGRSSHTFGLNLLTLAFLALAPVAALSERKLHLSRSIPILLGMGAIVLLSVRNQTLWIGAMTLVAWVLLSMRLLIGEGTVQRIMGITAGAYLVIFACCLLLRTQQDPLAYLFYSSIALLVLLNADFYFFLGDRIGKLHALAAIPLHMLFFFYSGVAFVLGSLKYIFSPHTARGTREFSSGTLFRTVK